MVKMLTSLFNKRKREIERLNSIIYNLQGDIKQYDIAFYNINARKIELERELSIANKNVLDLTNEIKYLKMQVENAKGEVNSRYY